MPAYTRADEDLCAQVAKFGSTVSRREIRTLREYGVIKAAGDGRGGRNKSVPYLPGSAEIVTAVQKAKSDPTYREKMCRAVLIAWARGAAVRTPGLRRAFADHYEDEERSATNLVQGKRVLDQETDVRLPPEVRRQIAAAQLGQIRTAQGIGQFEKETGTIVREAFLRSGQRHLLPANDDTLGLARRRSDGSWEVEVPGDALWESLAFAPLRLIARTAPRPEFDAALRLSRTLLPAHGFRASDLVTATETPLCIKWMRSWHGDTWWKQ